MAEVDTISVKDANGTARDVPTILSLENTILGTIADGDADSGNTSKVGGKVTTGLSGVTADAAGDRVPLAMTADRKVLVQNVPFEDIVSGNNSNTDGTSTSLIAAQGANVKTYLQTIILTNMSSTGIYVEIKDGATVKLTIPLPANSGCVVNLPVPIPGTANTAWNFDPSAAATTVYCSGVGFKSKV